MSNGVFSQKFIQGMAELAIKEEGDLRELYDMHQYCLDRAVGMQSRNRMIHTRARMMVSATVFYAKYVYEKHCR